MKRTNTLNKPGLTVNNRKFHLEDDEEGKEDKHKEQQAAGVQREEVILVREIRLRKKRTEKVR